MKMLLHKRQTQAFRSRTKRNVLNCGRRAGKTFFFSWLALYEAQKGRRVLYGAPTTEQTDSFWGYLTAAVGGLVKKNETHRTLEWGEGSIHARTAWDIDSWRGGSGDVIIMDEYAWMKDDPWAAVVQPMLLDNNGDAYFGSTPNRRNHHYRRYLEAMANPDRWSYTCFPSTANPHLSKEALDALVVDMTDREYRQEILAEYLPGEGTVFTVRPENLWVPDYLAHLDHKKLMALDLAQVEDFTSVSVGCLQCKKELELTRMKGEPVDQARRILSLWHRHGTPETWCEDNAAVPIIKAMTELGMRFNLFHTDTRTKPQMIAALQLALENRTWQFVDDPVGNMELESYEETQTRTGHMQFGTQTGHDDTIISRAIMVRQADIGIQFG